MVYAEHRTDGNRTTGLVMWVIGLALVLAAVWVLYTRTALGDYIPGVFVVALVLLLVGLAAMSMAKRAGWWGGDRTVVRESTVGPGPGGYVERREVHHYGNDPDRPL